MIPNFVVISTYNRQRAAVDLAKSLKDAERVVLIDNASEPPVKPGALPKNCILVTDNEQPPNLSRLWNTGLDIIAEYVSVMHIPMWNAAVLNDDLELPRRWLTRIGEKLREHPTAAIAFPDQHNLVTKPTLNNSVGATNTYYNMTGYAHIARGELGLRFDESMRWWYSDNDYEWQGRQAGGVLMVPGLKVQHHHPDKSTRENPELGKQALKDGQTFYNKWSMLPW